MLRAQFEANVFGWHDLTARLIPAMRAQGRGASCSAPPCSGWSPRPYRGAYCASKFAIEALADTLRIELAPSGIKVILIEPGPIASRFAEHALEAYRRNIDLDGSPHRDIYRARIARLEEGGSQTFKLGPEAVAAKLVHALESRRPKAPLLRDAADLCRGAVAPLPADPRPRCHRRGELRTPSVSIGFAAAMI